MAGFKFRLETVLGLAIRIQDQKAQAMADAQAALQAEEARLQGYLSQQAATRVELLAAQQQGDLQSIRWGLDFLARLAGQEASQRAVAQVAAEKVETARAELMTAAQKVQVLEKLKKKAREDWQKKQDRIEALFIDELATIRYAREGS